MADEESRGSNKFHDFQSVKSLLLDPSSEAGGQVKDRMIDIGLRDIVTCSQVSELPSLLKDHSPDLLLLDIDGDREAVCGAIQALRCQDQKAGNPFAVVVGLTASRKREAVTAALEAGVDSLLAKPVDSPGLRACLREQIEDRKDFIATDDYVGPDRRPSDREPSDDELVSVEVPNSLKSKANGEPVDPMDAQAKVEETLRSLTIQRVWHLAHNISELAENARKAMEAGNDFPLLGECVEAMESSIGRISELESDFELPGIAEVIASSHAALATISLAGEDLTARHFELLRVHADSVEIAMKQDSDSRESLVTELERAVAAVRASDMAESQRGGKKAAEADGKTRYSLKVRFLAWWEGIEPSDVLAARQEGA